MEKRWKILQADNEKVRALSQSLKISSTICKILVARGIEDYEDARHFFRPQLSSLHDPWLMKDMLKAVRRIQKAIEQQERILIYGDYDVDGTTAVACFYQFLAAIYSNIDFYIPHRYKEGYGISKIGVDYAAANNFSLIISLDCGIKSTSLIKYAAEMGIGFIICDHHLPDDELPAAAAILNPKQPGCEYPFKELCGCGVGFKLMQAIADELQLPAECYFKYLDLVATAIAADIVPIIDENRVLSFYGLQKVNENPCIGIKALLQLAGLQKKLTINNLVFVVAPRINAAGRMDDAHKVVQLLIENNMDAALGYAEMLHNDNNGRKEADSSITEEALGIISNNAEYQNRKSTVVFRSHWHKGVVGIVASRLIENYYKPTVVLTQSGNMVAGSARSIAGFNLYEAIHACREHLVGYGGHFAAAGLTMLPEKVEIFSEAFEKIVSESVTAEMLVPEITIDAVVDFKELTESFFNIICQMEPFGPENMRPVFMAKYIVETGYSKIAKNEHIRFVVKQNALTFTGIGFGMANKFLLLQPESLLDMVFTIDLNEWNGQRNIQLKVIDFRLSNETGLC